MTSDLRTCGRAAETILRETPTFAHPAALWTAAGLPVPGRADPDRDRLTAPPRFLPPPLPSPVTGPRPGAADSPHVHRAQPDPTPAHLKDCA
ncbi:hypothetical protein [Kitasatospora sp. NPDC093679]|uniref:hypothetical protein n=1 Tax=Kitasatospora sp. NPDC093679 TaxID=3154983 RepID=UPI00344ACDA3